jgi:hypothetical protein
MTVQDIDRGWQAIKRELLKAGSATVTSGVHADAKAHDEGLTTAQVGAFHEFGIGTPMRAWLAPGIDAATPELLDMASALYFGPLLDGKLVARQALGIIGERMQQAAQQRLVDGDSSWPALSDETKRRKANKIRAGNRDNKGRYIPKRGAAAKRAEFLAGDGNPLIDTGLLRQSVRYKVSFDSGFGPHQGGVLESSSFDLSRGLD